MREGVAFVGGAQQDARAAVARPAAGLAGVSQEAPLVGVERRVDGVLRHHGRQARGAAGLDQVSDGDLGATDAPADGRAHPRPFQVQSRHRDGCLGGADGGGGALGTGRAVVEILAGDGLASRQLLRALQRAAGQRRGAACLRQLGFRPRHLRLVGAAIDLEEDVALADLFAGVEHHALDVARHARANLDRFDRLQAADEFVPVGDRPLLGGGHRDRRRRWGTGGGRLRGPAATGQRKRSAQGQGGARKVSDACHVALHFVVVQNRMPFVRLRIATAGPSRISRRSRDRAHASHRAGAHEPAACRRKSDNSCRKRGKRSPPQKNGSTAPSRRSARRSQ